MTDNISNEVAEAARDLDKAPTGEEVIQRLLTATVTLQREHRESRTMIERQDAQIALLTKLVDSHQAEFEILKIREQGGGGTVQ
jgi:hypothetical protein